MEIKFTPIKLNDKGNNVKLLHQTLAALGFPVAANEVTKSLAGDFTLKQVRALQKKLGIRFATNSPLLDEKTIQAMIQTMADEGLLASNNAFEVSGAVKLSNSSIQKRQKLIAFDLDLRGVASYRKLKSLKEVQGGFEFLSEAVTDNKGHYRIRFYDWQYARAERKLADVVVFAIGDKNAIIGHSRIVNTEDYSDKGIVRGLDIILTLEDERTEYQALMEPLNTFFVQSKTTLIEIAKSSEQLNFTASELDIIRTNLGLAAAAALLSNTEPKLARSNEYKAHELLYGLARQDISLSWQVLYKKQAQELLAALTIATESGIIVEQGNDFTKFISDIKKFAISHLLDDKDDGDNNTLTEILSNALPRKPQRVAFLNALNDFNGDDYSEFWNTHLPAQPAFKNKPDLISAIQLTQQLTILTGNHQGLVKTLQIEKDIKSARALIDFSDQEWIAVVKKAGVPDGIEGKDEDEKQQRYANSLQNQINATFPTLRIAKMAKENKLGIDSVKVAKSIEQLLSNENFNIAEARIDDFQQEIDAIAKSNDADPKQVKIEAKKIQRVFQVSTNPDVMAALLKNNLHSSHAIASIPRRNFIKVYSEILGDEQTAYAVHQRSEFLSTRAEHIATDIVAYSQNAANPEKIMSQASADSAATFLENNLPNYKNLFGSPDLCECQHCRSVLSPAAYFVDLLRFLQRSTFKVEIEDGNFETHSPYDYLVGNPDLNVPILGRRPDLAELALSCENTNTLIPYIDLANEVMEAYVAEGSLGEYKGQNTGDATVVELRANPQHTSIDAYRILSDNHPNRSAKYPFSLPYHLPLDMIRTYSDFLGFSRYEVMQSVSLDSPGEANRAIAAEALFVSPNEYSILTGESVEETPDNTTTHELFGFSDSNELEKLSPVQEFMDRSGISYIELVELVKTDFINPNQDLLDYLEKLFSSSLIDGESLYKWLEKAAVGNTNIDEDAEIDGALADYNNVQITEDTKVELSQLKQWASDHFGEFQQVITLFEPTSSCNLATTRLKEIKSIYEDPDKFVLMANLEEKLVLGSSGISTDRWARFHRFIRLWRKTGWSIHETDLILQALGEDNISPTTIEMLKSVILLKKKSRLPVNQLAVLWGNIDTYGNSSLYKKLFLNKSIQQIDDAFVADAQGNYLLKEQDNDGPITLLKHKSTILAAFRIADEELSTIVTLEEIDIVNDALNITNLSHIYRYVVMAKVLKLGVTDVCKLVVLFNASPFSSASETYEFYQLAASTKSAKFKPVVLDYIFNGNLPADSKLGLDTNKVLLTAKAIRDSLDVINQNHQEIAEPALPQQMPETQETLEALGSALSLTPDLVVAKLSLTFQPEMVNRLMAILNSTAAFDVITKPNLGIADDLNNNDALRKKFSYVEASGRLSCIGTLTNDERTQLIALSVDNELEISVGQLYAAPADFINTNFDGVLSAAAVAAAIAQGEDEDAARAAAQAITMSNLLQRQIQPSLISLEAKLAYIYTKFMPVLKRQLQKNLITTQVANLVGLSEDVTTLLLADDINNLLSKLTSRGFSATYFKDNAWSDPHLPIKNDEIIDFSWGLSAPFEDISANGFSVQWESYIAAPASGEYILVVDVEEMDETFSLYLDSELIFEKLSGDTRTSLEGLVKLNAAKLHLLTLRYAENVDNAGIRLHWKTATSAPEIIPATAAYPAHILNDFVEQTSIFHRAAMFIQGYKISGTELNHLINFSEDFDGIDFNSLKPEHWIRIRDYSTLRNSVPQAEALLTDIFAMSSQPIPLPEEGQSEESVLIDKIHQATAWDKGNISALLNYFFPQLQLDNQPIDLSPIVDAFKDEIILNRFYKIILIVAKTGLSAETITRWGAAETDFEKLYDTAQLLKNAVKAKYTERQWLELAGGLSDKIRANQQQALISYLLVQPSIRHAKVKDADGLFEHLLIDVQMGACMDTSRIVQANAAIQLFINRVLLNLESAISPDTIDTNRWQWMKNYRVWEANRKVFLYPENWLAPEWRKDRSEFFKDLESHLLQNDITERSVEQGLRNYLMSLNEVANLDVCGMHQENYTDGKLKFLHVFGRTNNLPYKYFYRRWNEHQKWSAWEKVQLDIRAVEDGENSGVHLIPVVWKGRLYLFWPEFLEKAKAPKLDGNLKEAGDNPASDLEPKKYWEIRLAWSEYVDGVWSSKQVSKEFIPLERYLDIYEEPSIRFIADIDHEGKLTIATHVEYEGAWLELWAFILSDIISKIDIRWFEFIAEFRMEGLHLKGWKSYKLFFMKFTKLSNLEMLDNVYLATSVDHRLLLSPTRKNYSPMLGDPFFYSDTNRTYFIRSAGSITNRNLGELLNPSNFVKAVFSDNGTSDSTHNKTKQGRQSFTGIAFSGSAGSNIKVTKTEKLQFHTFHHPFSSEFVTRLNQSGISALMDCDTEDMETQSSSDFQPIKSDDGSTFEGEYQPDFNLVKPAKDDLNNLVELKDRTYYKEDICFDVYGANSQYNWELFFHAPLYIATRLSKNGKYEEAMSWFHYIFDPTTNEKPATDQKNDTARYWKVRPFKAESKTVESLEYWFRKLEPNTDPDNPGNAKVNEWRKNPFDPHLVASNRPIAYMKHVVIKYIENLIDWGDSLFRQFTRESVYEAIQLYVIASHVLGKRPEFVPKRGEIKTETYASLKKKLDDFGNALVELENIFPYTSSVNFDTSSPGSNLLGIGEALYFCIPANDKLLGYWDTVVDRLFKIRHCQDLDGVERDLALFAPPIDPGALIQARSQGLSLGDILGDLSSPPPIYRFAYLMQKANEFCNDVKSLGSSVLSALEKKDGEELGRLRASQETNMLERVTAIRERQVLAAKTSIESLHKSRETAELRLEHYNTQLLGNESITLPDSPTLDATLTANSQLPPDTSIPLIETNVDMSPVNSDESGVKIIPREEEQLSKNQNVKRINSTLSGLETLAAIANAWPELSAYLAPFGTGVMTSTGGKTAAAIIHSTAAAARGYSSYLSAEASQASIMSGYIRRTHDWTLQANLVIREIIQLDKQITSADIQRQIAEKELQNHLLQIENSKQVELFLKNKFTNQELYQWMKEQLFSVYKQSYNLAFEMAKKAEKAHQYELGNESSSYIKYGYWENSKQGLVAGDKLQLALRQLENSHMEQNTRLLELTKSVSLALVSPMSLIELKETGRCRVQLPEELFDLDYQGHYCRRVKSVSLTIPCVVGPYTSVNCTLRLINNSTRINTSIPIEYPHNSEEGLLLDDPRFIQRHVPVTSIATSRGQQDAGMFEFNFRDERYLPFEGAGAISEWELELSDPELQQFDYASISDVILNLNYTAKEGGGLFKQAAVDYIKSYIATETEQSGQPLVQLLNIRQDFPNEWHRFQNPPVENTEQILTLTIGKDRFPFFIQEREVKVITVDVFAKNSSGDDYQLELSQNENNSGPIDMVRNPQSQYRNLHIAAQLRHESFSLKIEEQLNLKLDRSTADDFSPDEVEDLFLILHYKLG
ncbi:MAG: hypothetical protein ACI88A_002496 [Paraglaciecola sp.]|jgi:hypothetical protein